MRTARYIVHFCMLVLIWLVSYKLASILDFFKPYSSLWFLPAGTTLAIVMAAPGYLKLAPLVANLVLAVPSLSQFFFSSNGGAYDQVLHSIRLYAIYGGAALILTRIVKVRLPYTSLRDAQWVVGISLIAAALAGTSAAYLHVALGNIDIADVPRVIRAWITGDAIGAIIVPPLLIPLLLSAFKIRQDWSWPRPGVCLGQIAMIGGTSALQILTPRLSAEMGSLWYLIIIPPVVFALKGGMPAAASAVFLTSFFTPVTAFLLPYQGELLALSVLLLISSIAGLLIGAAISDRWKAFSELDGHRLHLEEEVEKRTGELEAAYEFQRHLVRSMGHDLRQPMQSMNLMLEGLAFQLKDNNSAVALASTREMGLAASGLVSKILDYAKIDTGQLIPQIAPFPVRRVFSVLEKIYSPRAAEHGVTLQFDSADVEVVSDEHLILQVLSNHVDNALRLSKAGMNVAVRFKWEDGRPMFVVEDEIEKTQHYQSGSAGFGLEIVQRIARLLNAQVIGEKNRMGIIL